MKPTNRLAWLREYLDSRELPSPAERKMYSWIVCGLLVALGLLWFRAYLAGLP